MKIIGLNIEILDNSAELFTYRPICPSCGYKLSIRQMENIVQSTTPHSIDIATCPKCQTFIDVVIENSESNSASVHTRNKNDYIANCRDVRKHHNEMHSAQWKDKGITLFYEQVEPNSFLYNYYIEYLNDRGETVEFEIGCRRNMHMVCDALFRLLIEDENEHVAFGDTSSCELLEPLYISAKQCGNRQLIAELNALLYRLTDEDLTILESIDGNPRLPTLPEKFDNDYVITICDMGNLFCKSGYKIHHRHFGMKGYTESKWVVNPHRKSGVDAAKIGEPAMSFSEFIKMFDGYLTK